MVSFARYKRHCEGDKPMMDWDAITKCKMLAVQYSTIGDILNLAERMPLLVKCGPVPFAIIAHQMYYVRDQEQHSVVRLHDEHSPEDYVGNLLNNEISAGYALNKPVLVHYGKLLVDSGDQSPPRLVISRPKPKVRYLAYSVTNLTEYGYRQQSLDGHRNKRDKDNG
jgi:hypothetical protein